MRKVNKSVGLNAQPPFFDIYRDGVTQGMLGRFLACPQQFRYAHVEGLYLPFGSSFEVGVGNHFHQLLDDFYSAYEPAESSREVQAIHKHRLSMDLRFSELAGMTPSPDPWQYEAVELEYGTALSMFEGYVRAYESTDKDYVWKGLETVFDVPWVSPKTGKTIRLRGKRDGEYEFNKGFWLFETKTKGQIDIDKIASTLAMDHQTNIYLWTLYKQYGKMPAGVNYNVVRRPGLRRGKTESMQEFLKRTDDDIKSRPDHYFKRIECPLLPSEMKDIENNINEMMMALESWCLGQFHYRNGNSCVNGFRTCPFIPLCAKISAPEYARKDTNFPELAEAPEVS